MKENDLGIERALTEAFTNGHAIVFFEGEEGYVPPDRVGHAEVTFDCICLRCVDGNTVGRSREFRNEACTGSLTKWVEPNDWMMRRWIRRLRKEHRGDHPRNAG